MDKDFLDDLIPAQDAAEAPVVEAAPEPAPEPETGSDGPQRDDKGRFAAKGVEPETDAVPPTDKLPKEDYKAIREEREKRQAAERRLEALEQQFQQLQAPKETPAPPPTIWEDEQGWQQHLQQQVLQQADQLSRINASEMAARAQHQDFQEMFDTFNEMAAQNPSIVQQAMADPHPWGKAYQIAKNAKAMQELAAVDLTDLEAKIEARLREKLAAEAPAPAPVAIPSSLADAQSARTAGQGVAPLSLDDILGRR